MTILQADKTIDCSGKLCPVPIIETSKGIKQIEVGQVLKLIATDAGSVMDVPAWAKQTGHRLIDSAQEGDRYIYHIERTR